MNITALINPQPTLSLYLVSFSQVDYDQCNFFAVVAYSEEEASQLTPDKDVNYSIGVRLGYDCPEPDYGRVANYRDECGRGRSIELLAVVEEDLRWGYVPYSCYTPR